MVKKPQKSNNSKRNIHQKLLELSYIGSSA